MSVVNMQTGGSVDLTVLGENVLLPPSASVCDWFTKGRGSPLERNVKPFM